MRPRDPNPIDTAVAATSPGPRWFHLAWRIAASLAILWLTLQLR